MVRFKWLDLDRYHDNHLRVCILEAGCILEALEVCILEYPKELHELSNNYTLCPDKSETQRKILSDDQLKIADAYNIYVGINV